MSDQLDNQRFALATVSSTSFLAGTLVMISSFAKTNPWFKGDYLIIHDDLEREDIETLHRFSKQILVEPVRTALHSKIQLLVESWPSLGNRSKRFYSLQAFSIHQKAYDKLLFVDSDILIRKDISSLFSMQDRFVAAPEGAYYRRGVRGYWDYAVKPEDWSGKRMCSFNTGMMLLGESYQNDGHLDSLISMLKPASFAKVCTEHTDQYLLNRYFTDIGEPVTLTSAEMNYLLLHASAIEGRTKVKPEEAAVWHFNGHYKPWSIDTNIRAGGHPGLAAVNHAEWLLEYASLVGRRMRLQLP